MASAILWRFDGAGRRAKQLEAARQKLEEVQFNGGFQAVRVDRPVWLAAGELVQKLVVSQIVLVADQLRLSRLPQPSLQPISQPE